MSKDDGLIFEEGTKQNLTWTLPDAPPWRRFGRARGTQKGETYKASKKEVQLVNAAIYLRRPLLVTGRPGVGKTSLAYAVAWQLGLGDVLVWPINTRTTLQQGLYDYDAIARVRDASFASRGKRRNEAAEIGRYICLGPLGTAFLGGARDKPRVLLIDEIDKSDIDLPNDLLNIFEEGQFEIRELSRLTSSSPVSVGTSDGGTASVRNGITECRTFPIVFLTSNGEREFPPAFLRRCLRLDIDIPTIEDLRAIVSRHLKPLPAMNDAVEKLILEFIGERDKGKVLSTDQLLNAVFMVVHGSELADRNSLRDALLRPLVSSQ